MVFGSVARSTRALIWLLSKCASLASAPTVKRGRMSKDFMVLLFDKMLVVTSYKCVERHDVVLAKSRE